MGLRGRPARDNQILLALTPAREANNTMGNDTGPALAYVLCIPQNVQLFTADVAGDADAHKEALPKFLREER